MSNVKTVSLLLAAIISISTGVAMAADYKQNPFTLTYDGAITENVKGKVNISSSHVQVEWHCYFSERLYPANYNPSNTYPAVVVAHPNGGVKEQVAGLYAQRLAEQGYITIAADAAYQGASGGLPRMWISRQNRMKIFMAWLILSLDHVGVDAGRLGLLGVCGGGGYSLKAAQTDKRF